MMARGAALFVVSALVVAGTPATSEAQAWPAKPIRLVAAFAPGGGADFMARLIAPPLSQALGQTVIVENRVGASGIIGYDFVAKSAPDGHTLGILSTTYAILPSLFKLPYDPLKDLQPVSLLSRGPYVVAVHPSLPARDIRGLLSLARANPGAIPYASSGTGANLHLATEIFAHMSGIRLLHVPFKGTGPAISATLAGETAIVFGSMYSALPLVRAGRLRALAVSTAQRNPAAPDLPTVSESGVPGYDTFDWQGLAAPRAIPRAVLDRLNAEVVRILQSREVSERLVRDGVVPSAGTPEEFAALIGRDIETVRNIVARVGIKAD
jgi:tripartite-type tricarboxylate transporter receptor subunit TctC